MRDIARKARVRLCGRYGRLSAAGKKLPVVVAVGLTFGTVLAHAGYGMSSPFRQA